MARENISAHALEMRHPKLPYINYANSPITVATHRFSRMVRRTLHRAIARGEVDSGFVPSTQEAKALLLERLVAGVDEMIDFDEDEMFHVRWIIEEMVTNGMVAHGNQLHENKLFYWAFGFDSEQGCVWLYFRDEGLGFDPHLVLDPSADINLEQTSGRGIYTTQKLSAPTISARVYFLIQDAQEYLRNEVLVKIPVED